jgi:hypothetical protein
VTFFFMAVPALGRAIGNFGRRAPQYFKSSN